MRVDLGEQEQIEIGFAPLIDCIFLLLIFFLVATSFKHQENNKEEQELPIELPISAASFDWSSTEAAPFIIGVDQQGIFFVDNKQISTQDLHQRLLLEKQRNPERRIRIDGDKLTAYQNVVHVLDLCQFAGFTRIGVHTRN